MKIIDIGKQKIAKKYQKKIATDSLKKLAFYSNRFTEKNKDKIATDLQKNSKNN